MNVLRIINELIVVLIVYGFDRKIKIEKIIFVYDLGGGIFDVFILIIDDGVFEVIFILGDIYLGGEDFDNKV